MGKSVLAKSGRRYSADNIGLSASQSSNLMALYKLVLNLNFELYSTTVTSASEAIEFGEITQNKGYGGVQGHLRSPMSIPIESPYATSY